MNEKISVNTTSTNGKRTPNTVKGAVDVNILQKNGYSQISVASGQRTDGRVLINIARPDKTLMFSGTFEELAEILNNTESGHAYVGEIETRDTGGGIDNDVISFVDDNAVLVVSDDLICLYETVQAYEDGNGDIGSIKRNVPEYKG